MVRMAGDLMLFKQCNCTFLCTAVRNVHLEEMNSLCSMILVDHPLPTCTWGIGSLLAYWASEVFLHIGHQSLLAYWASEAYMGCLLGDIHCVKIHLVTSALESHYRCIVYIRATSGSSEALIQGF